MASKTPDEKRWEAENDARMLASANAIGQDPKRLAAAQKASIRLAKETEAEARAMGKVSKGGKRRG